MGEIWKSVLGFFIVTMIAATGIAITWANVEVVAANNYLEEISSVIRESNYSKDIVADCIQEAKEKGYGLEVKVYGAESGGRKGYAIANLEYRYELDILGVSKPKQTQKII